MIYITGDTHGIFDRVESFCESVLTTKKDVLIIVGDSGINYWTNDRAVAVKRYLATLEITLFLVYGNHEQRPSLIDSYQEKMWCGATVYIEEAFPNLVFAKCGEVYKLNGMKTLVVGGAYSIDKLYRLQVGANWFAQEQPDKAIRALTEQNLDRYHWEIDVVLTHTAPEKYEPVEMFLSGIDQSTVDKSTEIWLDTIEERLSYKKWYFGHYHCDKVDGNIRILFRDIVAFLE